MSIKQIKIISAVILFIAIFNLPYFYYQLLRWAIMVSAGYLAYNYFKNKSNNLGIVFTVVAILFNPLIPFYFDKSIWHIIDVITSGVFLISLKNKKYGII